MANLNRYESGTKGRHGGVTLSSGNSLVVAANKQRVSLVVRNAGDSDVFLGVDNTVTVGTGFPLLPDEQMEFPDYQGPVYVAANVSSDVRFFEAG